MAQSKYEFTSIGDMVTELIGAFMSVKAKTMFMHDEARKKEVMMERFKPFINAHNIAMIFSDDNIAKVRAGIIAGIQKLDQHYIIYAEPNKEKTNIVWGISTRGADYSVTSKATGFVSQINQSTILEIIKKFMPDAGL